MSTQLSAGGRYITDSNGTTIIQCCNPSQADMVANAFNGTIAVGIDPTKVKEMYEVIDALAGTHPADINEIYRIRAKAIELQSNALIK